MPPENVFTVVSTADADIAAGDGAAVGHAAAERRRADENAGGKRNQGTAVEYPAGERNGAIGGTDGGVAGDRDRAGIGDAAGEGRAETTMPDVADLMLLVASTVMPWVEPNRLPLSMMAPVIVLEAMLIPVFAVIVPPFDTLPEKSGAEAMSMPILPAVIVPLLVMPPKKVVTPVTVIPVNAAEIEPLLVIPPPALLLP